MQVKKNPELEIGRNSSLYFAIGLNIMLFLTWRALEFKTYEKDDMSLDVIIVDEEIQEDIPIIDINTPPPPPPPPAVIATVVQVVEDTEEIEETIIESTEMSQDDKIAPPIEVSDVVLEEVEEEVIVPFAIIEDVPVFPGCEGMSNADKKVCFERKVQEHVKKTFQYPQLAIDMNMYGRVGVMFTIDKDGSITNISTRGPDKVLEDEAVRIINALPRMTPGKQRGKPVQVTFTMPINFVLATN
ncbi:energy transducer TonB [Flavobacteriaceae bacterium XHP0103]|uniref:energy transducer TonB n=1 Tax=Marixanthotalea marina TaxID=2844359 RepID=UPI002989ABE1|nr:energy transducer TonB [Marixanthotalea marina]MBU3822874.1 energy transducer TonB [Marixanthotalea marina]